MERSFPDEIQKMSQQLGDVADMQLPCYQTREWGQPTNQTDLSYLLSGCSRPWCICCPVVVELVRTNLGPSFPLFHGLNSILNVKVLVGSGESPSRGLLHDCENRWFICSSTRRPHTDWLEIMKGEL